MSAVRSAPLPSLRPMRLEDLAEVVAVERSAYPFPWSEGIFRDCLRAGYCCVVLELDGHLAGYGILSAAAGEAHLLNLCVRPSLQRAGLGRSLLDHLLEAARERRADTVLLEVRPSNLAARRLYESAGFSEVSVRRGYYPSPDGREDALLLALALCATDPSWELVAGKG